MITIYLLTIKGSNWVYVGATKNLSQRKNAHRSMLRAGIHPNHILQREIHRLGVNAITVQVIKKCTQAEAPYEECVEINRMAKIADVANIKPAQALRDYRPKKPLIVEEYQWDNEARAAQSKRLKGHKGRKLTSEQSAYMNSFPKPPLTAERRQHIVDLGKSWGRPVRNKTTGEIFPSQTAAARAYGCVQGSIYHAIVGRLKTVKGCEWEYHTKPLRPRLSHKTAKPPVGEQCS